MLGIQRLHLYLQILNFVVKEYSSVKTEMLIVFIDCCVDFMAKNDLLFSISQELCTGCEEEKDMPCAQPYHSCISVPEKNDSLFCADQYQIKRVAQQIFAENFDFVLQN